MSCRLDIRLTGDARNEPLFQSLSSIEVSKSELFKHGIMVLDPPEFIEEDAFSWFQRKIPYYEGLSGDYVAFDGNRQQRPR